AAALDRLDGGISLLLHCPGFDVGHKIQADDITVDVLFSPHEHMEGGKELSKFLALVVQGFMSEVALPYLQQFTLHCTEEGVTPPAAPVAGKALNMVTAYLPKPELPGGFHLRCRCRKGQTHELAQDITVEGRFLPASNPVRTPTVKRSIDPSFLSAMQMLPAAKAMDNRNKGTIVSLGPRTDSVIDRYQRSNKQIIPAIQILS
ncbi:hypothetical protein DXG01_007559, partial [Tephrocybe rancida]